MRRSLQFSSRLRQVKSGSYLIILVSVTRRSRLRPRARCPNPALSRCSAQRCSGSASSGPNAPNLYRRHYGSLSVRAQPRRNVRTAIALTIGSARAPIPTGIPGIKRRAVWPGPDAPGAKENAQPRRAVRFNSPVLVYAPALRLLAASAIRPPPMSASDIVPVSGTTVDTKSPDCELESARSDAKSAGVQVPLGQ